jgi:signal peptidase I
MGPATGTLPTAAKWGFRVALAIGFLALLFSFVNPLVALFQSGLCFAFAAGIRRRRAWAAIAAAVFWLLPVGVVLLRSSAITMELILTMGMSIAVGALMVWAAVSLRADPAGGSGAGAWIAFLVLFTIGFVSFEPFRLPTASMEPTVLMGDNFFVETATWRLGRAPKRGDIVAFRYPIDRQQIFVKRVVGIPGDRISFRAKQLIRNGVPVNEPWAVHTSTFVDEFRDNFPAEPTLNLPEPAMEMLRTNVKDGQVMVPPDSYFVLGDNRDSSLDSRYWGFVRRADIIGSPSLIYGSYQLPEGTPQKPAGMPTVLDMRWNRLLKLL